MEKIEKRKELINKMQLKQMSRFQYHIYKMTAALISIIDSLVIIGSLGFYETTLEMQFLVWDTCRRNVKRYR